MFHGIFFLSVGDGLLGFLTVGKLFQFADEETIHVVDVGVDTFAKDHGWVETLLMELLEAGFTDFKSGLDELDVSVLESEFNDGLIFFDGDGASGVDDVATCLGVGIDAVNGCLDHFLLEMT